MVVINLKSRFVWNLLNRIDNKVGFVKYSGVSDGGAVGYYAEPCLSQDKVHWHGMCTPHGYLDFRGQSWRVKWLNVSIWLIYHLYKLQD